MRDETKWTSVNRTQMLYIRSCPGSHLFSTQLQMCSGNTEMASELADISCRTFLFLAFSVNSFRQKAWYVWVSKVGLIIWAMKGLKCVLASFRACTLTSDK